MKYRICLPWNRFIRDLRVLVRKLASRLATQRKSLGKFNLRPLVTTCRTVSPGLNSLNSLYMKFLLTCDLFSMKVIEKLFILTGSQICSYGWSVKWTPPSITFIWYYFPLLQGGWEWNVGAFIVPHRRSLFLWRAPTLMMSIMKQVNGLEPSNVWW